MGSLLWIRADANLLHFIINLIESLFGMNNSCFEQKADYVKKMYSNERACNICILEATTCSLFGVSVSRICTKIVQLLFNMMFFGCSFEVVQMFLNCSSVVHWMLKNCCLIVREM